MSPLFDVKSVERALDALLAYKYPAVDLSPVIRTPNPGLRSSREKSFHGMLHAIEETRAGIAALERKIEKLVFGVEQRRAAYITALAPVSGLPAELLVEIFNIVASDDLTSKARITLSHVSSLWRSVALGTKELWTVVQVPSDSPEMVHEFARRSGSLSLELSTRSLRGWPEDLALTSDEASRLSVLLSHSSPPHLFAVSLRKHGFLMNLERLIIDTEGEPHHLCGGMTQARDVVLDNTVLLAGIRIQMDLLTTLAITNSVAATASRHLRLIKAPLLTRLELSGIRGKDEDDHEDQDIDEYYEDEDPDISLWGYQDQITTLVLTRSDSDVFRCAFDLWEMPNLVSLTLQFTDTVGYPISADIWQLHILLRNSPRITHFYLEMRHPSFYHLFGEPRAPFLIPQLETLSLRPTTKWQKDGSGREGLIKSLDMRSNQPGIQRLRHLIISSYFMDDGVKEQQQYSEYVDKVTVEYS